MPGFRSRKHQHETEHGHQHQQQQHRPPLPSRPHASTTAPAAMQHTPHSSKPHTPSEMSRRDPLNMTQVEADKRLEKLRRRAKFLDAAMYVPCTCKRVRFGVDSLIGLVPVIGDFAGIVLALLYVSMICREFHTPASIKSQMFINVAIDFVVGLVPILGDIIDIMFKANMRNHRLIEKYVVERRSSTQGMEMGRPGSVP
ncbi:hypothetical protein H4R20_006452, partial [Coemansia guatemalensis]